MFAFHIITETLFLYRHMTGAIGIRIDEDYNSSEIEQLIWGASHVPGIFDTIINIFAIVFGLIIFLFDYWPVRATVEPLNMNSTSMLTVFVVIFAVVYCSIWARHTY